MQRKRRRKAIRTRRWIVAYDVRDSKSRARLAKLLLGMGRRIQRSVFLCRIDERDIDVFRELAGRFLDWSTDDLRCYPICTHCRRNQPEWPAGARLPRPGKKGWVIG